METSFRIIKKRRDFLRVTAGNMRSVSPALVIQAAKNGLAEPRFGFTATKKIGKANVRNLAKRRMRELVRRHLASLASPGIDYVLVARAPTGIYPFALLAADGIMGMRKCARLLSS